MSSKSSISTTGTGSTINVGSRVLAGTRRGRVMFIGDVSNLFALISNNLRDCILKPTPIHLNIVNYSIIFLRSIFLKGNGLVSSLIHPKARTMDQSGIFDTLTVNRTMDCL